MLEDKQSYIANFNCTFGKENQPMLDYFFEIILPAFLKEEDQKKGSKKKDADFFFRDVKLTNVKGEFVLAGLIVRSTTLEVKSRIIDGELVRTNEVYPSDPYSYFLINLKNHRMVLVKNQKGSPTLKNFSVTARDKIKTFIREENNVREEKLPNVNLNVVAIPFKGAIEEELKKVKKIKNVTLRFYPLNGDIIDNETVDYLTESLEKLGSKTGNITYNTPDNKDNVVSIIKDTKGLMKPTIRVKFNNGTSGTLKDDSFTEVMSIPLDEEETFNQNIDEITGKVINKTEFNETSEENRSIYDRMYTKLENAYNKLFKK
ncbi:hypothetical protein MOE47_09635 [Bacillus atrophaeus]|uniref:hypothetical protein n=1 Tax=Bacillus atrophaeus TaxID=1452 RepID=UPI00227F31DE|nr:hypothetical protein [Bacillus atrophaeus]MCY8913184.1 hypothetical protein [Bacillus atrophaeus]MCY9114668.1 hypothetical protein [Bacillus atrophaeus]MEC0924164.1 hypothetical protein [Bacillus atrophaeus]MEC0932775.1 hypothetical protein [Bacillus atrophaeus]